jgi:hypothetical protein
MDKLGKILPEILALHGEVQIIVVYAEIIVQALG